MAIEDRVELRERQTSNTYTIRGHHLPIFFELFKTQQENPDVCPEYIGRRNARQLMGGVLDSSSNLEYMQDVQGPPDESLFRRRDQVVATWTDLFTKFLVLPDSQIVKIHAGRDGICNGCIVGRHCDVTSIEGENGFTDFFLRQYGRINPIQGHLGTKELHYPNGLNYHSEHGLVVECELGVIRKVFGHMVEASQPFS